MVCQFRKPQTQATGTAASSATMGRPVKIAIAAMCRLVRGSGSKSGVGPWRRAGVGSASLPGAMAMSVVAVMTVPRWLEGAGRKSDRITEVMGRREYAYVTVAYGTVGFPGALERCSTEFRPHTCGVHCTYPGAASVLVMPRKRPPAARP